MVQGSFDEEFGTDDPSYREDRFYVTSTDGKDQSDDLRLRIRRSLNHQMSRYIEQRTFPAYRTKADIVRDALHHRLHWLHEHENDPDATKVSNADIVEAEIERRDAWLVQQDEKVQKARDMLKRAKSSGSHAFFKSQRSLVRDLAETMEEPWKSRVEEVLTESLEW